MSKSADLTKKHEACVLRPYKDSLGILTIGWGCNIEKISQEEADVLFNMRWSDSVREAKSFPWYIGLCDVRKAVIENMIYNMGLSRFSKFKQMIAAIKDGDYVEARRQMLYNSDGSDSSPWAKQVGHRAMVLGHMMEHGEWLD